jgi:hypothetical protein
MSRRALKNPAKKAAAIAVVVLAAATVATAATRPIGPSSIAGARLGQLRADYVSALGPVRFMTRLPHGLTRLSFGDGEVHVLLASSTGKGVGVLTSDSEYRTAKGVGPCSAVAALKSAYGDQLSPYRLGTARSIVAYRLGSLAFVVSGERIGSVMLASPRVPLSIALNAAQCGVGEEE